MSKLALALLVGLLLISAPLLRAEEDDYDSEEDSEDGSAAEGTSDEKDVVVVTKENWPLKTKYALVGDGSLIRGFMSRTASCSCVPEVGWEALGMAR